MHTQKDSSKCLLCKHTELEFVSKLRDNEDHNAYKCLKCGHVQMYPLLTDEENKEEYDKDKTLRFTEITAGSDFDSMRQKFSEWTKQHVDLYFDKLNEHKNVLELASGYGFFMESLNNRPDKKFNIEGVEIGEFRLQNFVGGKVYNLDLGNDTIPTEMYGKYDFIISMHLLEHIPDPIKYLQNLKPLLSDDGTVLFEVPNMDCFLGEISPEYASFLYFYQHCSYYRADTLRYVFEESGYDVLDVYTREIYSIENHLNWLRTGKPFTAYSQVFLPDERIEWINEVYKEKISKEGKGSSLIIEAKPKKIRY